eukprot:2809830-Pleurochrysis_carterae.AAC.1
MPESVTRVRRDAERTRQADADRRRWLIRGCFFTADALYTPIFRLAPPERAGEMMLKTATRDVRIEPYQSQICPFIEVCEARLRKQFSNFLISRESFRPCVVFAHRKARSTLLYPALLDRMRVEVGICLFHRQSRTKACYIVI